MLTLVYKYNINTEKGITFPSLYLSINIYDKDAYDLKLLYTLSKNRYTVYVKSTLLIKTKFV